MEAKKVEFKVEGTKFVILVDTNQDGQPLLTISLDMTEVPDEIMALFVKDEEA
jgi:hypothetical protein